MENILNFLDFQSTLKYTYMAEKEKDALFQSTQIFHFSKVSYASTLHECDYYQKMSRISILYLPIKSWRFLFPLSFDYFNEPRQLL